MFEVEFYEDQNGNEPIKEFIMELQAKGQTSKNERIRSEKILTYIRVLRKLIEARESKGLSQKELADLAGLKQPAIARLESMKATPQIDTLFKILQPLGYTLAVVPFDQPQK